MTLNPPGPCSEVKRSKGPHSAGCHLSRVTVPTPNIYQALQSLHYCKTKRERIYKKRAHTRPLDPAAPSGTRHPTAFNKGQEFMTRIFHRTSIKQVQSEGVHQSYKLIICFCVIPSQNKLLLQPTPRQSYNLSCHLIKHVCEKEKMSKMSLSKL